MSDLAEAYVNILPSTRDFKSNLESQVGSQTASTGTSLGKSIGGGLITALSGTIVAGAAAVTGAVGSIISATNATADYGDNIDKMSQKIGISAKSYQEWSFIMEHCGSNVDNLQAGMKTLSSVIADATNGSDGAAEKLNAVGLSIKDLNGLSQEEQLSLVVSSLQSMESGAERTSAATDLLGRSATDMGALLNMSAEETEEMRKQVGELGGVMSDDAVKAAAGFKDAMTNMQTALTGVKNNLGAQFLPSITNIMDGLAKVLSGDESGMDQVENGIASFMDGIISAAPKLLQLIGSLIQRLGQVIIDNLPMIVQLGTELLVQLIVGIAQAIPLIVEQMPLIIDAFKTGLANALPALNELGISSIDEFMSGIQSNLPTLLQNGVDIITNVANGILTALPSIIATAGQVIMSFMQGYMTMLPTIMQSGVQLVMNLVQGLISALPDIGIAAVDLMVDFVEMLWENFPQIVETGFELIGQLIVGIINAYPEIASAMIKIYDHMKERLLGVDWGKLGKDILIGIKNGIISGIGVIGEAVSAIKEQLMSKLTSALKIGSPSRVMRDEIGKWIPYGIAVGISDNAGVVNSAVQSLVDDATSITDAMAMDIATSSARPLTSEVVTTNTTIDNLNRRLDGLATAMSIYSDSLANGNNVTVTLEGDAQSIFKTVRRQNNIYKTSTGRSAFA